MSTKTQTQAVIEVMELNGGYATLKHLYEHVLSIPGVEWTTKTPFASMRRIVQNPEFFFKIRPGLWALNSCRGRLPANVVALIGGGPKPNGEQEKYRHYYYQGIIAELGNMENFVTYVPPQDKNRPFLNRTLAEVARTTEMPDFTYEEIVRRARTIDVVWLNERRLLDSLFEVEYSTDFQNSFVKFHELLDFRTRMLIVAPEARRRQYQDVLERSIFTAIRKRVSFLSCDDVEREYLKRLELNASRSAVCR